jgi:membrane associated rhomboid family serine protease
MRARAAQLWRAVGYVPVAVLVVAAASQLLLSAGLTAADVDPSLGTILNPLWYLLSMVIHAGPAHFRGNMWLLLPFGAVLTVLTSNRHVLGVVLVSHGLSNLVWVATTAGVAVGTSGAAFGVVAATLVRATGYAFQNASTESLQTALAGMVVPFLGGFFLVVVLAGPSRIAHLAHFFAFLFGGAMETMYVLTDRDDEGSTGRRTLPY